jgi:hypothetical protein
MRLMPRKVAPAIAPNRRGSPEAIAKRRAARAFNDLLDPSGGKSLDGRTEKRRQRLLAELESGKARGSGKLLKPIDVLSHVAELFELGETVTSLRKVCRPRPLVLADDRMLDVLGRLHHAYGFPTEAYAFVGISDELLRKAGILGGRSVRRSACPPPELPPDPPPPRRRRSLGA